MPLKETQSGNQWTFSHYNRTLTPASAFESRFCTVNPATQRLIDGIKETYIADGWGFTDLVGRVSLLDMTDVNLALVFTNGQKSKLSARCPAHDFLKPEFRQKHYFAVFYLPEWGLPVEEYRAINRLLTGTNLICERVTAMHNQLRVGVPELIFKNRLREVYRFQEGVGIIQLDLIGIDIELAQIEKEKEEILKSIKLDLEANNRQGIQLLTQRSDNPEPLMIATQ